jgi:hypothetical protein
MALEQVRAVVLADGRAAAGMQRVSYPDGVGVGEQRADLVLIGPLKGGDLVYVHASDDDLQQGRSALARIHKIA